MNHKAIKVKSANYLCIITLRFHQVYFMEDYLTGKSTVLYGTLLSQDGLKNTLSLILCVTLDLWDMC